MIFYWVALRSQTSTILKTFQQFIWKFPVFLSVSMGMSLHNGIAVFEGYIGRKSPFIRTPKFNLKESGDKWHGNKYLASSVNAVTVFEGLLFLYFLSGVVMCYIFGNIGMLPLFITLTFGFGYVFFYSIFHSTKG